MTSQEKGTKKRKRTRNTSADQYEIYINFLKSDNVFRSGIINPTLEDNYMQKKWQELTELLNSSPEGPHMGIEEWKKRFSDWKYGVRAKARKIIEYQNKTGSGPQTEIKLTPTEDKALSLWGKVVVTGTPLIDGYDGLPSVINQTPVTIEIIDDITAVECTSQAVEEISFAPQVLNSINENEQNSSNKTAPKKSFIPKPATRVRHRPKPLSDLAEKLIDISTNSERNQESIINTLNNCFKDYMKYKTEEQKLQQRKINFEIAKYKFENPNFYFEDD